MNKECACIGNWWLNSLKDDKNLLNNQEVVITYQNYFLNSKKGLDDSGVSTTNNLLEPGDILGLISLEFIQEFHSANSCPDLQYLLEKYDMLGGMEETDKLLGSLSYKLIE